MAGRGASSREGARRQEAAVVLDSWAILAWLQGEEPANTLVKRVLKDAEKQRRKVEVCTVNLGEVYTGIIRERGLEAAEETRKSLKQAPMSIESVRETLAWRAGKLKASYSLSFADTFAAALALEHRGVLYTGDLEFVPLEQGEGLKVRWLTRDKR
jgi:predicted nucleic acid-binding protein